MSRFSRNKSSFPIKPLAVLVSCCISTSAYASAFSPNGNPHGPFADVPLHLQSSSESKGASGVKPNVLLQIDDSGSMGWDINGNGTNDPEKQRITPTRRALLSLVQNPKYRDAVNWHMISLCNTEGSADADAPPSFEYNAPNTGQAEYGRKVFSHNLSADWRFGLDVQKDLVPAIQRLRPSCGTPSTSRYLDAIHILQTALERPGAYRCQKSYVVIFSDGEPNDGRLNMLGNSHDGFRTRTSIDGATPGTWTIPDNPAGSRLAPWWATMNPRTYLPPSNFAFDLAVIHTNKGPQQVFRSEGGNYVFAISNWLNSNQMLGFLAGSVYEHDLMKGGTDAAGKSWDDTAINGGKQTITTFTVGLGLNSPYLDAGATGNNGQAIRADNQAQLDAAFAKIFDQINNENKSEPPSSFSSISPTLAGDDVDIKVPALAAAVRLDLKSGSSEVRFYDVKNNSGKLEVQDSYKTPDFSNRYVLIHTGEKVFQLDSDEFYNYIDSVPGGGNRFFGIPHPAGSKNRYEFRASMIPWLMRKGIDNHLNQPGNKLQYRERKAAERNMGDVIAAPIYSYGPQQYGRQRFFITAANDGMVYLFQSSNKANHPYTLSLNYIPGGMGRDQASRAPVYGDFLAEHFADIVAPDYITNSQKHPHRYMINGGMTIRTTENTWVQRLFMVGNMGQGGRGSYALNISGQTRNGEKVGLDRPQNEWVRSVPLFETPKGNNNLFGYTIGAPQIGRVAMSRSLDTDNKTMRVDLTDVRYGAFIGSGTRHPSYTTITGLDTTDRTEAALYIYNILDKENVGLKNGASLSTNPMAAGEQIGKILVPDAGNNRGGLMQPTLIDMDFDGTVDIAYAADFRGGLYRFDLRGAPGSWSVHKLFQAQDKQVVTSAPAVYRRADNQYIVVFGTGSDLYQQDLTNKDTQSVYGIYDDLTQVSPATVKLSELLPQYVGSASNHGSGKDAYQTRNLSNEKIDLGRHKGWYFNLPAGERVVVKPDLLLKTVVLTTRNYSATQSSSGTATGVVPDPCVATTTSTTSKGESWLMQVKVDNGGNLQKEDSMQYAYIDFAGANTQRKNSFRPDSLAAGFRMANSGIINYALIVGGTNTNTIGHTGNAVSLNGDSGGTGTDPALTPGGRNVRQCFTGQNHRIYLSDSSNTRGVENPLEIYGQVCAGGLTRISWREIF